MQPGSETSSFRNSNDQALANGVMRTWKLIRWSICSRKPPKRTEIKAAGQANVGPLLGELHQDKISLALTTKLAN